MSAEKRTAPLFHLEGWLNLQQTLNELFTNFIEKQTIFKEKDAVRPTYLPDSLIHRQEQMLDIGRIFAPVLRGETPSNLLIFGWTGSGKTAATRFVMHELRQKAQELSKAVDVVYLNCKMEKINTEYRLLARIAKDLGKEIPVTGLPTTEVYNIMFNLINDKSTTLIVILDEIDEMDQASNALYNLTRINYNLTKGSRVAVVGISNKINFFEEIDPRVKSSFSGEELTFPPYNAPQLKDILEQRANKAFLPGTLSPGVIQRCAAIAAQEHGDARQALDLLRVAGEIAERRGQDKVTEEHVNDAQDRMDMESVTEVVRTQPKQSQAVLYSILLLTESGTEEVETGDVFNNYSKLCNKIKMKPLTQRRISDLIEELRIIGVINANVVSKGRGGRTRTITLKTPQNTLPKIRQILKEELMAD